MPMLVKNALRMGIDHMATAAGKADKSDIDLFGEAHGEAGGSRYGDQHADTHHGGL